jgi:hypothetical protein
MRDAPDQPPRQVNGVVGYPIQPLATACFGPVSVLHRGVGLPAPLVG